MVSRSVTLDIHNFAKQYEQAEALVARSDISARNKTLIFGFRDACLLQQVCGKVRLIRAFIILQRCARLLGKDFDTATREDLQRVISTLLQEQRAPATVATYKGILKRFMSWVLCPDEFPKLKTIPPSIAWITSHVRKRDQKRLQRTELLTPTDIEALLLATHNPRDRALIATLWETGCRIAELGNLQLKHITKNQHGYTLDVTGKTGQRSPLVVSSAPYLTQWLTNHPFRDNPESPLWVHYQYTKVPRLVQYASIRTFLTRAFTRAGINKPFYPHIFRHSRATWVLANGIFNESQAKSYFGWTPDSAMLGTYSHLVDQDANNAVLRENNLTPLQQRAKDLTPVQCRVCSELNQPKADYCAKCGAVLDLKKAYEHQAAHTLKDDVVLNLMKLLVERGLVDEAVEQIHDAGLGPTLKRLVEHHEETQRAKPPGMPPERSREPLSANP